MTAGSGRGSGGSNSPGSARGRGKSVLRVGWLIDGLGGAPVEDQVIVINHGRIESIRPLQPGALRDEDFTDLSSATVLPALMDAHVHLALSGTLDPGMRQAQLSQTPEQARRLIRNHLHIHLKNGIVAVRDAGDKLGQVLETKSRRATPIDLAATCWAWHAPGRYGAMIGQAPSPAGLPLSSAVARAPEGLDHIKLIQSGINSLDHFGLETSPQFSDNELALVRRFALSKKLRVMVHANGRESVGSALTAGCDSIEHGYFMGRDNLNLLADRQIFWVPTAIPMEALTREGVLSSPRADVARRTLEHQLMQIAAAFQAGVRLAVGTDAGSMGADHGVGVRREMALFMEAGLPLPQAVRCATLNNAQLMGMTGRGALQPGWRADMIAVNGGPESLPRSLETIAGVCVNGQWLHL